MKTNIHVLAPLLLLILAQFAGARKVSSFFSQREIYGAIPLSMAKESVDDMYCDCRSKMSDQVKKIYFPKENKGFLKEAWRQAELCTKRSLKYKEKAEEALTKDQLQAICLYTSGYKKFYDLFNYAVRTNRSEYDTTFQYHSVHFWLTSAIQTLNRKQKCLESYRRSNTEFIGEENQIIRFGNFASSSLSNKLTRFGKQTCFRIKTCYGAYLKKYPHLQDREQEVLIPPYEMFTISNKISNGNKGNLADCKVVYVLRSIGIVSILNCKAAN